MASAGEHVLLISVMFPSEPPSVTTFISSSPRSCRIRVRMFSAGVSRTRAIISGSYNRSLSRSSISSPSAFGRASQSEYILFVESYMSLWMNETFTSGYCSLTKSSIRLFRYPVTITISLMPLLVRASIERCSRLRSPILSRHFGVLFVKGRRREAIPAARIIAFILLFF